MYGSLYTHSPSEGRRRGFLKVLAIMSKVLDILKIIESQNQFHDLVRIPWSFCTGVQEQGVW